MLNPPAAGMLTVPVAPGELLDKKTILEIKRERIADGQQRANVERELALLESIARGIDAGAHAQRLAQLERDLRELNAAIWDLENTVRACERDGDFGKRFVATARSIYASNDRRAAIKREINLLLRSSLIEEKSHTG